jgi:hypothetical protein
MKLRQLTLCVVVAAFGCKDDGGSSTTAADGTTGGEDESAGTADATAETGVGVAPTWHQDIAPVVAASCGGCHRAGGVAPFSMETYAEASPFAQLMLAAVEERSMPPFGAETTEECEPRFGFVDDLRLTPEQEQLLREWVDAGVPEGDPATAAPIPEGPTLALADPDVTLPLPSGVTVEAPGDDFYCFTLDPSLTQDTWLEAVQINPGNDEIVHHVLLYVDESGESTSIAGEDGVYDCFGGSGLSSQSLLFAWAPGAPPFEMPPNTAMLIPAGSRLVAQIHYHPIPGGPQSDDSTTLDLRWYEGGIPQYAAILSLAGNYTGQLGDGTGLQPGPNDEGDAQFRIPAGVADHEESMIHRVTEIDQEVILWLAASHMHYVGTDMLLAINRDAPLPGEPDQECLLHTPHWDFNWQRGYVYDGALEDLPRVRPQDLLYMRCRYDNSMDNPFVAEALAEQGLDAPVDVGLGEETLDEMCLGVFGVAVPLF